MKTRPYPTRAREQLTNLAILEVFIVEIFAFLKQKYPALSGISTLFALCRLRCLMSRGKYQEVLSMRDRRGWTEPPLHSMSEMKIGFDFLCDWNMKHTCDSSKVAWVQRHWVCKNPNWYININLFGNNRNDEAIKTNKILGQRIDLQQDNELHVHFSVCVIYYFYETERYTPLTTG